MVVVDTSVWIDFLAGRETPEVRTVDSLIQQEETLCYTGPILQELLQGCSGEKEAGRIEDHFESFVEIFPQRSTYLLAAKLFRDCRKRGYTIRSSVDCLIAACSLEYGAEVLHKDRDFTFIAQVSNLTIHGT
jgi:predicted nucleic acid-binding protein